MPRPSGITRSAATFATLVILCMVAGGGDAAEAEAPLQLPQEWQGTWGIETDKCFNKDLGSSDTLFQISGGKITGWESECKIEKAVIVSPADPTT